MKRAVTLSFEIVDKKGGKILSRNKFAAVGEATHHIYFEAESKAEVFRWLLKKYPNQKARKGNHGYSIGNVLPEIMRVVRLRDGISKRRE